MGCITKQNRNFGTFVSMLFPVCAENGMRRNEMYVILEK